MSSDQKFVRVQVQLDTRDKVEAEFLTQEYYGMPLAQFLKLVTKLLIHERLDVSMDFVTTPNAVKEKEQ